MKLLHFRPSVLCALGILTLSQTGLIPQKMFANNQSQTSTTLPFDQIVIFGDSLSDVGNLSTRSYQKLGIVFPGPIANYDTGRFTDGPVTYPAAKKHLGIWHEQLAKEFLKIQPLTPSLIGGDDYSFGGATTQDGVISKNILGITLDIDNIGKQINDYLSTHKTSPTILYVVWGGGNDLLADSSDASAVATAHRIGGLVRRLIDAGGRTFLVPNLPPLGKTPGESKYSPERMAQLNNGSNVFALELAKVLDQVDEDYKSSEPAVQIYRLDVDMIYNQFAENPSAYGFANMSEKAQWNGLIDPDKYLFWDSVHPTTTGHYWIAAEAYSLLTGTPLIHTFATGDGFYISRTGSDLSHPLKVQYHMDGSEKSKSKTIPANSGYVRVILQNKRESKLEKTFNIHLSLEPKTDYQVSLSDGQTSSESH